MTVEDVTLTMEFGYVEEVGVELTGVLKATVGLPSMGS